MKNDMQTFEGASTTFNSNTDLSGDVVIRDNRTGQVIEITGSDLLAFIVNYVRDRKIDAFEQGGDVRMVDQLEQASDDHILGFT